MKVRLDFGPNGFTYHINDNIGVEKATSEDVIKAVTDAIKAEMTDRVKASQNYYESLITHHEKTLQTVQNDIARCHELIAAFEMIIESLKASKDEK